MCIRDRSNNIYKDTSIVSLHKYLITRHRTGASTGAAVNSHSSESDSFFILSFFIHVSSFFLPPSTSVLHSVLFFSVRTPLNGGPRHPIRTYNPHIQVLWSL